MKLKIKTLFAAILLVNLSFAQNGPPPPQDLSVGVLQAKKDTDFKNVKTNDHVNVPGTRIFLVLPKGYKLATSFIGLEKENSTAIQIFDLVGGNFYSNAKNMSIANFQSRGFKVFDFKEMNAFGYPAKYMSMQGAPEAKAISMVFGDTTFCVMINAMYASDDKQGNEQIQEAINSIFYDKNFKVDPFATSVFTLDETKSTYKFSNATSGIFTYTVDGKEMNRSENEPFIMVSAIPNEPNTDPKTISEMVIANMEKYGLTEKTLSNVSTSKVNGHEAYEVEIHGKMKGVESIIYQLTIKGKNQSINIQAIIKSDFDAQLNEAKKLIMTLKLKE